MQYVGVGSHLQPSDTRALINRIGNYLHFARNSMLSVSGRAAPYANTIFAASMLVGGIVVESVYRSNLSAVTTFEIPVL